MFLWRFLMFLSIRLGEMKGRSPVKESQFSFLEKIKQNIFQNVLHINPGCEEFVKGKNCDDASYN